ncbi:tail fiber domain-containing protein, partial [Fulvivirga lutimaris]|uniref:tail fiber domain-containing protein n=1 Tax=Fulvivirga lutimaris TaxID=1819566 RepID=UPI00162A508C
NLSDVADAATSRTNLGLGTLSTQNTITTADITDITSVGSGAIITGAERTQIGTNTTDIATNTAAIAADADGSATNELQTLAQVLVEGNNAGTSITGLTDPTNAQDAATKAYVDASTGWGLTGNAGTNPANEFIGTTDAAEFNIRTNDTERVTILSDGNVGIRNALPLALLHATQNNTTEQALRVQTLSATNAENVALIQGFGTGVGLNTNINNVASTNPAVYFNTNSQAPTLIVDWTGSVSTEIVSFRNAGVGVASIGVNGGAYFDGDVGIGIAVPTTKLDIVGAIKIADGTEAAGSVLTSDADGLASWQTPASSPWTVNGSDLNYTTGNVGIGTSGPVSALQVEADVLTGEYVGSFINTNVADEDGAALYASSTSSVNADWGIGLIAEGNFLGIRARGATGGTAALEGDANGASYAATFVGDINIDAGSAYFQDDVSILSTSNTNTVVGQLAGDQLAGNENNNTLVGYSAGSSTNGIGNGGNTMVGGFAGSAHTTGIDNVYLGASAGISAVTGTRNTFVGTAAGFNVTSGTDITLIGSNTDATDGLTNATAIGAFTDVVQSNTLILGNGANVGIGTNTPAGLLCVDDDVLTGQNVGSFVNTNTGSQDGVALYASSTSTAAGWGYGIVAEGNWIGVQANGGAGGDAALAADANGATYAATFVGDVDVVGSITYTGSITQVSDRRLKENIIPIENVLSNLTKIQGYSYNMIDDSVKVREYGVMAQDVQAIYPYAVKEIDDYGHLGVSYTQLIPVLLEATKEQQQIIDSQKQQIEELTIKLKEMEVTNKVIQSTEASTQAQLDLMKSQIEKLTQILTAEASKGDE